MNAVFRCDATADIGFGHLSRCQALAEALETHGVQSRFVGLFDPAARDQINAAGFSHEELSLPVNSGEGANEIAKYDDDFVIVDSYRADSAYLASLQSSSGALVVIDDFCELEAYPCDVILNFTSEAPELAYPSAPVRLLGPQYLLTRRKLVEARALSVERHRNGPAQNVLIAVGGSDPKGITARLVRLLGERDDVVVQTIAQDTAALTPLLSGFAEGSRALPRQPDLSQPLLWADVAITGGGLIKYESAYMGVPCAAIAQNEGQDGETQVFQAAGLVFDLGLADRVSDMELAKRLDFFLGDEELRANMATTMQTSFPPDPSNNAAKAILEAVRN